VKVKRFMEFLMSPKLLRNFEGRDLKVAEKLRNHIFNELQWYLNAQERFNYQKYKREMSEK